MTFLVDANVLSEPTKPAPDFRVDEWLQKHESDFVVDSVILGEVRIGLLKLPPGRKRQHLEDWFEKVVLGIVCLPWDATIALRWADLVSELQRSGKAMPTVDSMIAATALAHDLTIVTRNVRDFQNAGVRVLNPFEVKHR